MSVVKVLAAIGIISTLNVTAQNSKIANIWYFGEQAGLDFTNGNPTPISNGAMSSYEGVVSLSDASGNLLFYSNGGDLPNTGAVWNRNHQIMPNGYLNATGGCSSSIQSSLAIPKSGDDNVYYLFNTDCYENNFAGGLTYSIVDMNLDGGLGDLAVKGVKLTDNVTESLAGVKHANGKDYWLISHKLNQDTFYVYHLNKSGIAGIVKTKIGPIAGNFSGEIKVSTNSEKLVFCGSSFTALFNFDANTGVISNYVNLNVPGYTASFSPDCELLYVIDFPNKKMYQFDLMVYNISGSKIQVGTSTVYMGSMQQGPDGKIYISRKNEQYLAVINSPALRGLDCNYQANGIYLNGKIPKYGLPNFTNNVLGECVAYPKENISFYNPELYLREAKEEEGVRLEVSPYNGAEQYRIAFKKEGDTKWETITSGSNFLTIENLEANAEYKFRFDAVIFNDHIYEVIPNHQFEDVVTESNNPTGIGETAATVKTQTGFDFSLYPNPAKNKVSIELNSKDVKSSIDLTIYDANGKVVFYENIEAASIQKSFELPANELPNGVYNVSLRSENITGNKKLIVMK